MLRFLPPTSSQGFKFEDCVHGDFDIHAFSYGSSAKVRDKDLEDTHMANHTRKTQLLFHIDNDRVETVNDIAVAFTTRESLRQKRQ